MKKTIPSLAQLIFAQMRVIAAGELAGAGGSFWGTGARLPPLAQIALLAFSGYEETSARALEAQNTDWQRLARDCRDVAKRLAGIQNRIGRASWA